jgi:hypothetical protein
MKLVLSRVACVIQYNGTVFAVETFLLGERGEGLPPRTVAFGARIFVSRTSVNWSGSRVIMSDDDVRGVQVR